MRALEMAHRVIMVPESSPDCIPGISPVRGWDFVFVDGWHLNGQPLRDVQGLVPHMAEKGVIFMHDMGMPDVNDAGKYLASDGWTFTGFTTANFLSAFYKVQPDWWDAFLESVG
jgi:hypothetical protein